MGRILTLLEADSKLIMDLFIRNTPIRSKKTGSGKHTVPVSVNRSDTCYTPAIKSPTSLENLEGSSTLPPSPITARSNNRRM